MTANALALRLPSDVQLLPDEARFIHRFNVKSGSSDRLYVVAQSRSGRWWSCGCHGWLVHKHCRHLDALGLPGHYQPFEVNLLGAASAPRTGTPEIGVRQAKIVRPRRASVPGQATRRLKEIAAARPRYDAAAEGFGDPSQWVAAFEVRMGLREARRLLKNKDAFAVLGLHPGASKDDIRKAYRQLAFKHHPDRKGSEAEFKQVTAAFTVLTS